MDFTKVTEKAFKALLSNLLRVGRDRFVIGKVSVNYKEVEESREERQQRKEEKKKTGGNGKILEEAYRTLGEREGVTFSSRGKLWRGRK